MHGRTLQNARTEEIGSLFREYLQICNKIIDLHKGIVIETGRQNLGKDWTVDLAVYEDRPLGAFTLAISGTHLVELGKPQNIDNVWRVNMSDLIKITNDPDQYIHHPEKMKMDWFPGRYDTW